MFGKLRPPPVCVRVLLCVCALPVKMEVRSTGAWLVSTVILNLVVLAGEEGTHTNARGRLNLDWRTLGTPEKKKIHQN